MKIEKIEKWIEKLSAIPMEEGDYEKRQERIEKLKLKQQWLRNQSETKGNIRGREKKIQKLTFMIQKLSAVPKDEGNEERRNHRIQNLQRKLDWIQSHPEDYEKNDKMTWREQKIARINCCIQRLENIPEEEGNYERRMIRIENLRQNLAEIQKKDKVKNKHTPLSPEQKEKIRITKEKINQLKETISSKKVTIGSKRREMADADIPKKASLKTDIENLRKEIEACKSELFPLRREICQLHKRN
jgi:chromosome segregation ATPase